MLLCRRSVLGTGTFPSFLIAYTTGLEQAYRIYGTNSFERSRLYISEARLLRARTSKCDGLQRLQASRLGDLIDGQPGITDFKPSQ